MSILDQLLQQTPSILDQMVYRLSLNEQQPVSDPDKELAEYYADLLNLFLHGMTTEPKELLDLAEADLEGTKYKLRRDQIGFWQVVPVSVQFSLSHRTIWLGAQRSPKGGITIQGKFYRGGQFIPGEVLKHATPQEKKKLEQRKAQDEANTEAKRGERLARGVDVEGLSGNLEKFKAELNPRQMGNAKRAFAALKRHHGDQVYHRIEELHNILAASLDANEGREWLQDQLRNRLAGLSAMIGMAKDAGIVAPEKPADTKKRAGKAAKVRSLFSVVRKYGGIDPSQIISDAGREGLVQEGLLGVTVRGGMGLDDMADALEIGGHIKIPDNKNGGDYLRELLKAKAASLQDVAESYESELERSYAEYYRQAEQAGIEARDIEEAVRSGEEAGEVEGSEEEYDEALGDLTAEQLGGDDSFGFGANVEEETGKVIGKGNMGEVISKDGYIYKNTSRPDGFASKEGEIYEKFKEVDGFAEGEKVGDKIKVKEYQEVLSLDTVPDEQSRKSMGGVVAKGVNRLLNVANALASENYDYNDPLQVGYDDAWMPHVLDFSNAGKTENRFALDSNIGKVVKYLEDFGAEGIASKVDDTYRAFRLAEMYSIREQNALAKKTGRHGSAFDQIIPKLSGFNVQNAYYSSNPRHIEETGRRILQGWDKDKSMRLVLTEDKLDDDTIRQYGLVPVVHGGHKRIESSRSSPDQLQGGKADNVPDAAFPQDELAQGTQHELEHTGDKAVAKDIAKDHLAEDKGYYDKLEKSVDSPKSGVTINTGNTNQDSKRVEKMEKTDAMIKAGGKLWESYGKKRIYFNNLSELIGLETDHYNTGNISSATIDGEAISNTQARKLLARLDKLKIWYDFADDKFHIRNDETWGATKEEVQTVLSTIKELVEFNTAKEGVS